MNNDKGGESERRERIGRDEKIDRERDE